MGAAAGRFSAGCALGRHTLDLDSDLTLAVGRRQLAAVDEVLQLLLVLVGMAVGVVAEHAALLGEVLERRPRVTRGPKTPLAGGFGRRERSAPTQPVEQPRPTGNDAGL